MKLEIHCLIFPKELSGKCFLKIFISTNTLKLDYYPPDELWSHQNPEHLKNVSQEVEVQDLFLNCGEFVLELMTEIVPRITNLRLKRTTE